jgi:hypothetical protein
MALVGGVNALLSLMMFGVAGGETVEQRGAELAGLDVRDS